MQQASDEPEFAGRLPEIDNGDRTTAAPVHLLGRGVDRRSRGRLDGHRCQHSSAIWPYCKAGCVAHPYTAAAEFVPRDYLWRYPALLLVLAFVTLAGGLHDLVPGHRRAFIRAGLSMSVMGASLLVVDYALQLTVMQPALLTDQLEGVSPLSQYNPISISPSMTFWPRRRGGCVIQARFARFAPQGQCRDGLGSEVDGQNLHDQKRQRDTAA